MGKLKDEKLFNLIHDYFTFYLPHHKSASKHTLRAYRKSVDTFLDFLKCQKKVSLFNLSFDLIDRTCMEHYLVWLETERGSSPSTCSQRLACLKAFLKYCSETDVALTKYYLCSEGLSVKHGESQGIVEYLSEQAIRMLIAQPDTKTRKGRRDMFLMILLYDTGARIDELLSIKVCDIRLDETPTALLYGKGKKYRHVPIADRTAVHFRKYLREFHSDASEYTHEYLFYGLTCKEHTKMSANSIRVLLQEYGVAAKKYCPEIPTSVHPHMFRHSRAMHLYQGGMDLTLVSQWLGHANLQTTLVYAHADTEQKRAAIELATGASNPIMKGSACRFTVDDEDTLKCLYGLK